MENVLKECTDNLYWGLERIKKEVKGMSSSELSECLQTLVVMEEIATVEMEAKRLHEEFGVELERAREFTYKSDIEWG